jgi:hypothetical protein
LGNLQKDIQKLIKGLLTRKEKFHYLNKKSFAVKVEIKTSFSQFFREKLNLKEKFKSFRTAAAANALVFSEFAPINFPPMVRTSNSIVQTKLLSLFTVGTA